MAEHVMVDLETLKGGPRAAVIEIGACVFNPERGTLGETASFFPTWGSSTLFGEVDGDTIEWWFKQSNAAREHQMMANREHLSDALLAFELWFPEGSYAWGNGASFDLGVLASAYEAVRGVGASPPWKFYRELDFRTVRHIGRLLPSRPQTPRMGTHHSGCDDAVSQAIYVIEVFGTLGLGPGRTPELNESLRRLGY